MHNVLRFPDAAWSQALPPRFRLGDLEVRADLRLLVGPAGEATVEPRVLQVLLALVEAGGAVVTRDSLLEQCWQGVFVGGDALTRAIAEIRRALRETASADVSVETISKSGYRLVAPAPVVTASAGTVAPQPVPEAARPALSRRGLLVLGAAGVAAAGAGWWAMRPSEAERAADNLVAQGWDSWRLGLPGADAQGVGFLEEAVRLDPGNGRAWGLLALLLRNAVEAAGPEQALAAFQRCQVAIRRALALDPRQGDALAAEAGLLPIYGDWTAAGERLRRVLEVEPGSVPARSDLGLLQMSTGRVQDATRTAERLAGEDPLAAVHHHRLVYRLWATGRLAEMDRLADRALQLWPGHPAQWFARMWTFAYTGRANAALQMLADTDGRPDMPPPMLMTFTKTMEAIGSGRTADVAGAVELNLAMARRASGAAVMALQHMAFLGALDQAFEVARGYLLREGPLVGQLRQDKAKVTILNDQHQRKTLALFLPATAAMRADGRFAGLMADIGMTAHWERTGLTPDHLGR